MNIKLNNNLTIVDTYQQENLVKLDEDFLEFLKSVDRSAHSQLVEVRASFASDIDYKIEPKSESALLIEIAPHLDNYLAKQFNISEHLEKKQKDAEYWQDFFVEVKRKFVQRRGLKKWKPVEVEAFDEKEIINKAEQLIGKFELANEFEKSFANKILLWLSNEEKHSNELEFAGKYSAWAIIAENGKAKHQAGLLFKRPEPFDHIHLVPVSEITMNLGGKTRPIFIGAEKERARDGFNLTDNVSDSDYGFDQSHYCIWCHAQGRDSCSIGVRDKKTNDINKSALGVELVGCPLGEKISEMNLLKASGKTISSIAVAMVDNPMIACTGHRICNECAKACIYQKQTPVDIPQAETRNFEDLINLPFGFEIYSLLTRWNPLNLRHPFTKTKTEKKVLVVGLGPAGYTISHHLLQDGHTVVAIDGLKIEPLSARLSGVSQTGERVPFGEVAQSESLFEGLDNRILAGFGGVSEYGITVRWNKNYLKLVRIILERNQNFRMFGGIRFGNGNGTITIEDAFAMGFDHIALCMGAGKPTVINMPNGFARGVRQSSDFLMALQLTGASKLDSLANLQLRMPVLVIGGGLTAIDTATEALAYYVRQVEKFALRELELDCRDINWQNSLSAEEKNIADEFINHGKQIIAEREKADNENRLPDFIKLVNEWGGATVIYRRQLIESPAYTLNHEEISKAFEEGIRFAQLLSPEKIEVDEYGHCCAISCVDKEGSSFEFPARAILIAAGTTPNTVIARENKVDSSVKTGVDILLDGKYFQAINLEGEKVTPEANTPKPISAEVLMHKFSDGKYMSFFGDLHPSFFGNVVKAMASAKQGYPIISKVLANTSLANNQSSKEFINSLNQKLLAKVVRVDRLTKNIVEIVIHAPQAATNFQPGQFYRLQNYETTAKNIILQKTQIKLATEGLALTGAWVDKNKGEVGLIALEMGGSSNLIAKLEPNESVILMGPTGAPTEIRSNETVLLAGGGLGNAVLFSIGAAFRARGSKVLYFAGYKALSDRYHVENIELAADVVVWCSDEAPGFEVSQTRGQDKSFVGNIVEAMIAYADGSLGESEISMNKVGRIIAIGSQVMMSAVAKARHNQLKPYLSSHQAIASINSPMQCMMKEICSQCMQVHIDHKTGKTFHVFSCFNQDQDIDSVDWNMLSDRLKQNSVQEKQTSAIINLCLNSI